MSIKNTGVLVPRTLLATMMTVSSTANADLLISEYVEGSSYNKAIELYNTSDSDNIDLSGYKLVLLRNGAADNTVTLNLSGTLESNQTYLIVNNQASDEMQENASLVTNDAMDFNGDDPMQLQNAEGVVVDTIGSGSGSDQVDFEDQTFARKAEVLTGSSVWKQEEWDQFAKDYIDGLGYTPEGTFNVASPEDGSDSTPRPEFGQCGDESSRISAIQGTGDTSPVVGNLVTVQGIVTRTFPGSNLYYVQQSPSAADTEGASVAIQVYDNINTPEPGDEVYIRGVVDEYYGMTQLVDIGADFDGSCSSGNTLELTQVTMEKGDDLEPYEGMTVALNATDDFYVTETYKLNRYGETMLAIGGVRQIPTNLYTAASEEAIALQKENDANIIVLDDGISDQNAGEITYLENLSDQYPLRVGSKIASGMEGVLQYSYGSFRLIPDDQIIADGSQVPRPEDPEVRANGDRRVASFNVLNYFNGLVNPDGSIDWSQSDLAESRGADNAEEFQVQRSKTISALARMDADIIGILEMENDGWDEQSAIHDLVNGLNASAEKTPGAVYSFVKTSDEYVGTDAIKVSLLYNESAFELVGAPVVLTEYPFDNTTAKHRPPMIQTFKDKISGEELTVVINHFKSKGSSCEALADPEDEHGQGNCNRMRVTAAETLGLYLEENYAGKNVLVMGDLNAYAKEDPMLVLTEGENRETEKVVRNTDGEYEVATTSHRLGYKEVIEYLHGTSPVSYVFDGEVGALDHVLASPEILEKITQGQEWAINSVETITHDYNAEFKDEVDSNGVSWYDRMVNPDSPFRSSDHDPVIIDIRLDSGVSAGDDAGITEEEEIEGGSFGFPMLGLGILSLFILRRRKKALAL
ncbi:ExeM/NucH family extracellular endonuclease [Endozoicomonas sp. 4G]|uniref:ExeM/NucH family extracellular endonuclease n=1 Tax=Endozoicomonas sp. 4G TaxID=2872754 RepID=UPI002078A045|nr:ExeM/NucH family extracellular endonuclease [Endozoicomonas sp. 4G]